MLYDKLSGESHVEHDAGNKGLKEVPKKKRSKAAMLISVAVFLLHSFDGIQLLKLYPCFPRYGCLKLVIKKSS